MGSVPLTGLKILEGADVLTCYRFHTEQAAHFFCSICGIYTHHVRRIDPSQCGYNVGCLEGVDATILDAIPVSNGRHHPLDEPGLHGASERHEHEAK